MSDLANGLAVEKYPAISERSDVAVTHIAARRGAQASLAEVARAAFGVDLPMTPHVVETAGLTIVWAGPDQWLIVEPQQAGSDPSIRLAKTFNGLASVVDVSDSRTIFRLAASHPSDALVRSMGIDFEGTSFGPGDVAITHVSHLGVMVWRLPDGSGYDFACARTYSRDFLAWLGKA
ncbi:sarcosine oxidase subunit gamma [Hyphomicrobium sp.]|uniref:sarcosine oxidase subunit gamma n=1 Tax=Hyphomicrobium sp. TaxID=82 RepID=UPI003565BE45